MTQEEYAAAMQAAWDEYRVATTLARKVLERMMFNAHRLYTQSESAKVQKHN